MLGGGAFNAKPVLNTVVFSARGCIPMAKRGSTSSRGYGARIRDSAYDENIYTYRGIRGRIFGALTVEFGDKLKARRKESTKTSTLLGLGIIVLYYFPKDHGEVGL
jgi:hypothetical protein